MSQFTRRSFIQRSAIAAGALVTGGFRHVGAEEAKRSAADWVTLGRSGVRVTRLGLGTGSNGGRDQREMGQEEFTRMIRHAYDRGIRFFDTAENYGGMHQMLSTALEGIDRDSYVIQTKMRINPEADPWETIDRFRRELRTDYFDSFLMHCAMSGEWTTELQPLMDRLDEVKEKEAIRSHGVSIHGLAPLSIAADCDWLDVSLLRINHDGTYMDGPTGQWAEPGVHDEALAHIKKVHASGCGVIGMKIFGNGDFTDPQQRDDSVRYVMSLDCVDAIVVGCKSIEEVDEAIERVDRHLNT